MNSRIGANTEIKGGNSVSTMCDMQFLKNSFLCSAIRCIVHFIKVNFIELLDSRLLRMVAHRKDCYSTVFVFSEGLLTLPVLCHKCNQ